MAPSGAIFLVPTEAQANARRRRRNKPNARSPAPSSASVAGSCTAVVGVDVMVAMYGEVTFVILPFRSNPSRNTLFVHVRHVELEQSASQPAVGVGERLRGTPVDVRFTQKERHNAEAGGVIDV